MGLTRTRTAENVEMVTHGGAVQYQWHPRTPDQAVSMSLRLDPNYNSHLPPHKNPVNPPYHLHYRQREVIIIKQGSVIFTIDGKDVTKTKAVGSVAVDPGTYHTFRADPTSTEDVVVHINAPVDDHGVTERFFRNIYSYQEDCLAQKVAPNVCQIFLFLYSTDTYPVLPGPKFIGQPLSRYLTWFLGVVVGPCWETYLRIRRKL